DAATAELTSVDLVVSESTRDVFSVDIPAGDVAGTDPGEGTAVAHGETVTLLVSKGAEPLPVPALDGETEEVAKQLLETARFTATESRFEFDSEAEAGLVLRALGTVEGESVVLSAGDLYPEAQPITLVVSAGPIPPVEGLTVDKATAALSEVDLIASTSENIADWSDTVEAGRVLRLSLPDGAVSPGMTVQLVVSRGVEQVAVPNVVGKTWAEARTMLEGLGFRWSYYDFASRLLGDNDPENSVVKGTDPSVGQSVDKGSE